MNVKYKMLVFALYLGFAWKLMGKMEKFCSISKMLFVEKVDEKTFLKKNEIFSNLSK
jgi:hypothetical protein